jgi:hypothetical protein
MLERERLAGALAAALAEEIEAPLQQLLGLMGVVADEVGALAESDPSWSSRSAVVLAIAMLLARTAHLPVHELRSSSDPSPPRRARSTPARACRARCGWRVPR